MRQPAAALAGKSGQRQQWLRERHELLEAEGRRITNAGGTGLSIDNTQVVARKSLVELSQAAAALRAVDGSRRQTRRRMPNRSSPRRWIATAPNLMHSPGPGVDGDRA